VTVISDVRAGRPAVWLAERLSGRESIRRDDVVARIEDPQACFARFRVPLAA
jgi:hypothetical protein